MTMTNEEFIKNREALLKDEGNYKLNSDVINMLVDIEKEYILPLLGRPFYNGDFTEEEKQAVVDAVYTCLCETRFSYMMFAINQLEVLTDEDGGIVVIFDALTINGDIVRNLEAVIYDFSSCGYASWKLDWLHKKGDK